MKSSVRLLVFLLAPGFLTEVCVQQEQLGDGGYQRFFFCRSSAAASAAASFVGTAIIIPHHHHANHKRRAFIHRTNHWSLWLDITDAAAAAAADKNNRRPINSSKRRRRPLKRTTTTSRTSSSSPSSSVTTDDVAYQRQRRLRPFSPRSTLRNNNNIHKQRRPGSSVVIQFWEESFPNNNSTNKNAELTTWMQHQVQMLSRSSETMNNATNTTALITNTTDTATTTTSTTWQQLISSSSSQQQQADAPSWTSHDETALIRYLKQRQAYQAILLWMRHLAVQHNLFTYTAAISSLASSDNERHECWNLFEQMQYQCSIRPSSYTYSALFQACQGPAEAVALYKRLVEQQKEESTTTAITTNNNSKNGLWTKPVWESAIYACARTPHYNGGLFLDEDRKDDDDDDDDNSIQSTMTACDTAKFFVQRMQTCGRKPSARTYLALLFVCAETREWKHAKELYESLEEELTKTTTMTPRLYGAVLQVCAVTGEHEDALQILQTMHTKRGMIPNVRHCTSYLKALVTSGKVETAMAFLLRMAGANEESSSPSSSSSHSQFGTLQVASPDSIAIQTVLQCCNYEQAQKLLYLAREGELGGLENMPDERFYNTVLSKCQEPKQAKDIIRQMQLSRRYRIGVVPPSKLSYTKAITVCRKAQDVDSARFFLASAKDNGIEPDVYMYSAAVWAAAASSDVAAALEFLDEMQTNDCSPNIVSYNGVIAAFAAKEDCAGAVETYETAVEQGLKGESTTFYHLAAAARKVKDPEERIVLLKRVLKPIAPQECTIALCGPLLETLMGSYGSVGRIEDAMDLFDRIQGPCNLACLRAITFACSAASPPIWRDAISILHTSDILGGQAPMFVDQVALGYVMLACSKANEWEESLRLLHLYGGKGVPIAAVNSLIASCGRGGRPDVSLEVLNEMESSYGLSPDARSYRNAVIACNQAEHAPRRQANNGQHDDCNNPSRPLLFQWWECALSLLRRMKEDGLKPDIQTYSSVISACEAAGKWQRALGVLQSMMDDTDDDGELNVYCFNAAIAACEKGGAWVEALELYERMQANKNRLLQPTVVTYGSLILALDKAGQKEIAVSIWQEAVRKGLIRPWKLTRDIQGNMIRALDLHKFSAAMARACLRSHLESSLSGGNASSPNNKQQQQPLTIVAGKGLRSQGDPVLLPTVQKLLWDEYGIRATVDEENTGRIVLGADILEEMIARKRWR